MAFPVEDALDELYGARPQEFTELRKTLAARAKAAGDQAAARRIMNSRKPTTAAWVVNTLVLADGSVRTALSELGSRLRDAHAAMDGDAIRALTAEQRRVVEDAVRRGLRRVPAASPALRDDVTATLQAAVADPDVTARLGRLTKAERWSGFGELGASAAVASGSRAARAKPVAQDRAARESEPHRRARAALAAAEREKAQADAALTELQADLSTARLRLQDARRRLADAENTHAAAEDAYDAGKRAGRDAAEAVRKAAAELESVRPGYPGPSSPRGKDT